MKNICRSIIATLVLAMMGVHSQAATISLVPGTITALPGETFSVDMVVAGLADAGVPSLSVFDIDIAFDPLTLSFASLSLADSLGLVPNGEAIDVSFGLVLPGIVNVAEVSFLASAELDALQSDTFVLATLDFIVSGLGAGETSNIEVLSVFALGDGDGAPIAVDGTSGAQVTAVVPLPAALWLFISALALVRYAYPRSSWSFASDIYHRR